MRYVIFAADRETGRDRQIEVTASSPSEAESLANQQGLLVSSVQPISNPRRIIIPSWLIATVAIVATVAVVLAFVAGFFAGREHFKSELRSSFRSAFSGTVQPSSPPPTTPSPAHPDTAAPTATRPAKPEFDVILKRFGDHAQIACQSYVITNESATPLTIHKVVYNGEFEARRGRHDGVWVQNSDEGFPVTLSIGDRAYAVQSLPGNFGIQRSDYTKSIIFLEVYTDRGVFKFSPAGVLLD